jgi:hypothetical protein
VHDLFLRTSSDPAILKHTTLKRANAVHLVSDGTREKSLDFIFRLADTDLPDCFECLRIIKPKEKPPYFWEAWDHSHELFRKRLWFMTSHD